MRIRTKRPKRDYYEPREAPKNIDSPQKQRREFNKRFDNRLEESVDRMGSTSKEGHAIYKVDQATGVTKRVSAKEYRNSIKFAGAKAEARY